LLAVLHTEWLNALCREDKEVRVWDIRCSADPPTLLHVLPVVGNARALIAGHRGEIVLAAAGRDVLVWR
jgi:hypothetical protein